MAKEEWRYVKLHVDYLEAVATMTGLARALNEGLILPTILWVTMTSHSICLPMFPDYYKDVNVEFCKEHGIHGYEARLLSGGGVTWINQTDPAMFVIGDRRDPRITSEVVKQYEGFITAIAEGVKEKLGLELIFRPVNDVHIVCKDGRRRKCSNFGGADVGNAIWRGGFIYRCDADYDLMDKAVTPPPEKFADKEEKEMRAHASSLSRELGREVTMGELEEAVKWGVSQKYGVTLVPGELTDKEREYRAIFLNLFKSDALLYDRCEAKRFPEIPPDVKRSEALYKVPRGPLIRVTLLKKENKIHDILITGTMHTSPLNPIVGETPIHEIERRVKGLSIDEELIREKVGEVFALEGYEIAASTPDDFVKVIMEACAK
jgi:lipoate-protein ligase A